MVEKREKQPSLTLSDLVQAVYGKKFPLDPDEQLIAAGRVALIVGYNAPMETSQPCAITFLSDQDDLLIVTRFPGEDPDEKDHKDQPLADDGQLHLMGSLQDSNPARSDPVRLCPALTRVRLGLGPLDRPLAFFNECHLSKYLCLVLFCNRRLCIRMITKELLTSFDRKYYDLVMGLDPSETQQLGEYDSDEEGAAKGKDGENGDEDDDA